MSLCARCGLNAPLPEDPDDFCGDCIAEVDALIDELQAAAKRRRAEEYHRLEFDGGAIIPEILVPSDLGAPSVEDIKRSVAALRDPARWKFTCDPCECGGNPECPRCNG